MEFKSLMFLLLILTLSQAWAQNVTTTVTTSTPHDFTTSPTPTTTSTTTSTSVSSTLTTTAIQITECGSNVQASSGFVSSKNWPQHYPANDDCATVITVPEGSVVYLKFMDFKVELNSNCGTADFLEIKDGSNAFAVPLATLCGYEVPRDTFISSGNSLYLHFKSDALSEFDGYRAQFDVMPIPQ